MTAPWLPGGRRPKEGTLGEFVLLHELLEEGGKAIVGLQRELPAAAQVETATEAQRRASYNTADQVGRGKRGPEFVEREEPPAGPVQFTERARQVGDEW